MNQVRAGIIGGAGYTGGELIRILLNHPFATIRYVFSNSNAGKPLHAVHNDLLGQTELTFSATFNDEVDVIFLCVGHGDAKKFLDTNSANLDARIVDLSQDYRLHENGVRPAIKGQEFVYGLPELNREQVRQAKHVANPGCFATAIQLGLLPLAKAGLLDAVYTTGITGSTGAGQSLQSTSHFSWRANNIQAYKTLTHQHLNEIGQSLHQLQPDGVIDLSFVPWRGDFTRGIFISSQLEVRQSQEQLEALYSDFYNGHPFTIHSKTPIFLKQAVNTNNCFVQLEKVGDRLVVHTAMDNLLKGASGQAVQNMNLMFGLEETSGLKLKANFF